MTTSRISAEDRLRALSKERTELLQRLREEQLREQRRIRPIQRDTAGTIRFSTSCAQQRLWFVDQMEGAGAAYFMSITARLHGVLDRQALARALDQLLRRHEVLRSVFGMERGEPYQEVRPATPFELAAIDLRGLPEAERESQVNLQEMEETRRTFSLETGPLIRGRLLQLGAEEHVLLITIHHIVCDGWSMDVLIRELTELYAAALEQRAPALQPLPIQYADYAHWQREWLQGRTLEKQLRYWRGQLEGAAPQLELPTDRPRPAAQSYRGEHTRITVDAALTARLKALAQRHDMTVFMVLYAGLAILLHRLSGQEDIVIGTPLANRRRPEVEALIGLFVNPVPLRIGVRGDLALDPFLRKVRDVTLGAYDHQDVPFEKLVEALQPERSLARNPLFQVLFALQNAPVSELRLPRLTVAREEGSYAFSKFDLEISFEERDSQIVGMICYATDLFDRETIEHWMDGFSVLLDAMTREGPVCIGELPILSERARQKLVQISSPARLTRRQDRLIHEVFEERVERAPDRTALIYEDQSLTYAELDRRANQLAQSLRALGVGPERRVAIFLERSLEMVVAMLATLKAGGAFVPLDPVHSSERLAQMLEDSTPVAVLTQAQLRARIELPEGCVLLTLGEGTAEPAPSSTLTSVPTNVGLSPSHPAYVIYTSGSTGVPKGVVVSHSNLLHFLHGLEDRIHSLPPDCTRIAWNSSFGFDMAAKAWGQLTRGRTVYLIPESVRLDAERLLDFLEKHGIEAMECTPSHLRMMQAAGFLLGRARSLRKLLLGGEAIEPAMWNALAVDGNTAFFNMYGPTECSVDASCGSISGPTPNLGRVMPNAAIYVLDEHRQPVPIGVVGEIYIGGDGVARGYLNRAELTAERFIADPFSSHPGSRMYKTGDLGRWRSDGTLQYTGRNDDQVKVRGFRIELGDIEAALRTHARVKQAVVLALEEVPGEKRLVAWVVPHEGSGSSAEELRAAVTATLPDYMVPSAFVMLDRMPLTPNGKVDRRALSRLGSPVAATGEYEAPQGEDECILARLWQDLLKVERVGRRDNFFELGGHSLLATRMIARARELLQVDVPLKAIFDAPVLSELALRMREEVSRKTDALAANLRQEISELAEEAVLEQLAELESEIVRRGI